KQDLVEKFVNNCAVCTVRKPAFHTLAARPIIAKNFLTCVQSNNGRKFVAQVIKELVALWPSVLLNMQTESWSKKLGKWQENTG
ncbi:3164_t:CDS:2, partial [Racocetra fulgida]